MKSRQNLWTQDSIQHNTGHRDFEMDSGGELFPIPFPSTLGFLGKHALGRKEF